ncbi:MAG: hypothetical protein KDH88_12130 [Chromatiales bacterium]|nr:hypothetical protein [Chromatiales bacterium]
MRIYFLLAGLMSLGPMLVLVGLSGHQPAWARDPVVSQQPDAVLGRLENVSRLVITSTGSRRVQESGDAEAIALRRKAMASLDAARASYDRGDMAATNASLQRATEEMFRAIRRIGTGQDGEEKKRREYESMAKSVDVLLAAVERVANEKGGQRMALRRAAAIRARGQESDRLAKAGKLGEARLLLDRAYQEARTELEKLRHGETLVRSLSFASKKDEYHYELDRNDTHRLLLKILSEDKKTDAYTQKRIDGFVSESDALRGRAEREAGGGAYDAAVRSLEESTKALQRAIRSAGVFIPG